MVRVWSRAISNGGNSEHLCRRPARFPAASAQMEQRYLLLVNGLPEPPNGRLDAIGSRDTVYGLFLTAGRNTVNGSVLKRSGSAP